MAPNFQNFLASMAILIILAVEVLMLKVAMDENHLFIPYILYKTPGYKDKNHVFFQRWNYSFRLPQLPNLTKPSPVKAAKNKEKNLSPLPKIC